MTKELADTLKHIKELVTLNDRIVLTKHEAKLVLKYIHDLEKAVAEGVDL